MNIAQERYKLRERIAKADFLEGVLVLHEFSPVFYGYYIHVRVLVMLPYHTVLAEVLMPPLKFKIFTDFLFQK